MCLYCYRKRIIKRCSSRAPRRIICLDKWPAISSRHKESVEIKKFQGMEAYAYT